MKQQRDPEMHQTRKGKHALPQLLHGQKARYYGDSAYASQKTLAHSKAPTVRDFTNRRTREAGRKVNAIERNRSKRRVRVEHVFAAVKRLWGFAPVLRLTG